MKSSKSQRFNDLPDILTVAEASAVLRINKGAAYELVRRGELPAVRIGRRVLVPKAGLAQLLGFAIAGTAQAERERPSHQSSNNLTLRGSFVITVQLQGEVDRPEGRAPQVGTAVHPHPPR